MCAKDTCVGGCTVVLAADSAMVKGTGIVKSKGTGCAYKGSFGCIRVAVCYIKIASAVMDSSCVDGHRKIALVSFLNIAFGYHQWLAVALKKFQLRRSFEICSRNLLGNKSK